MPHVLGLLLSLCSTHCPAPLPIDAVQLTLTPARLQVCLLHLPSTRLSCVELSAPAIWFPVRRAEQLWRHVVALSAHGRRSTP
ncbi:MULTISPECIES: hypothetical protein [Xanthomonas]|uniref:Uncharacterized protein n=1 Tax=Xanthomonas arboricola TaxID=56448 RepID=A0A2S7A9Q0_9XANT|nr:MULTISPECIES: hypothetical protein [Xanthomonas]MBB5737027.1 hypothetical protein [Xanthomonas sp. CFBP 8152]PPT79232.1 hypothetical protein XarbCFBP8152_10795 [Xanthomonas arboricola]PPU05897.1 hypothetical protein XarjCFBP7645_14935 [Xanthomonas arboricola]